MRIIDVAETQAGLSRSQVTGRFDPIAYQFNTDVTDVEVSYDFQALASDPEFIATVSNLQVNSRRIVTFATSHLRDLERLEAAIARARGLEPMPAGE